MNILVLIISNDSLPHYAENKKVWLSYMNRYHNIHCFFIEFTPLNEASQGGADSNIHWYDKQCPVIENNTLYLQGEESFENILLKTLNSMDYFLHIDNKIQYDFIVRTNLSSIWDFDKLQSYLETLPKNNIYTGHIGPYYHLQHHHFLFYFIGGMGIIMSRDVCQLLLENRHIAESFKNMDDIDIGYTMNQLNISILPFQYGKIDSLANFEETKEFIKQKDVIFYRAKSSSHDRSEEPIYMKKIVELLYE